MSPSDLIATPVIDDRLPPGAADLVDRLVLVERVVVEVRRGDLLEDRAGLGPELVPDGLLDQLRVARVEDAAPAFDLDVEDPVQDLEGLLFPLVIVRGMALPRKMDDEILVGTSCDALDERCS